MTCTDPTINNRRGPVQILQITTEDDEDLYKDAPLVHHLHQSETVPNLVRIHINLHHFLK